MDTKKKMTKIFNLNDIKERMDLNLFVSREEINFIWESLNFKALIFYNNGLKFKYKPINYFGG